MDIKSLKGIAVVSIEQGEKVGVVDNALFDLEKRNVIAFKLIKPGFRRAGGIVITMDDVESIGKDAVMIRDKEMIRELKHERELQDRPDIGAFTALRVVSQDGTYVGNVATVQIDTKSGHITELEITGGSIIDRIRRNKVIPAQDIISIGSDVVIVPDQHAPKGEPEKDKNEDEELKQITEKAQEQEKKGDDDRIVN